MRSVSEDRAPEGVSEAAPASVRWAVRAMYGGAAAAIAGIGVNVATLGVIREQRPIISAALQTSTQRQAIAEFIIGGVAVAAIWVFMALACRAGKSWARMTSTALFAVYTVYTAEILAGFDRVRPPGAVQAYTAVVWAFGLAAVILLWHRGSATHFRRETSPR